MIASVLLIAYFTYPVANGLSVKEYDLLCEDLQKLSSSKDIYMLKYMVSTGVSWVVVDSTDKDMIGENVVVKCFADPRFLKINKNFAFDTGGHLFVVSDKKKKVNFLKENVWCLSPSDMHVYVPDEQPSKDNYKFSDMRIIGTVKSILGVVFRYFSYSF